MVARGLDEHIAPVPVRQLKHARHGVLFVRVARHVRTELFGQIEPRVLFAADGYTWAGKPIDSLARVAGLVDELPSVERVVVVPYLRGEPEIDAVPRAELWDDFGGEPSGEIEFESAA